MALHVYDDEIHCRANGEYYILYDSFLLSLHDFYRCSYLPML